MTLFDKKGDIVKIMNICAIIALSSLIPMLSYAVGYLEEVPGTHLVLPPKPSEAKGVVEVTCISKKTQEKKSIWMPHGPGARVISNKEVCLKHFGEDFEAVA